MRWVGTCRSEQTHYKLRKVSHVSPNIFSERGWWVQGLQFSLAYNADLAQLVAQLTCNQ